MKKCEGKERRGKLKLLLDASTTICAVALSVCIWWFWILDVRVLWSIKACMNYNTCINCIMYKITAQCPEFLSRRVHSVISFRLQTCVLLIDWYRQIERLFTFHYTIIFRKYWDNNNTVVISQFNSSNANVLNVWYKRKSEIPKTCRNNKYIKGNSTSRNKLLNQMTN